MNTSFLTELRRTSKINSQILIAFILTMLLYSCVINIVSMWAFDKYEAISPHIPLITYMGISKNPLYKSQ